MGHDGLPGGCGDRRGRCAICAGRGRSGLAQHRIGLGADSPVRVLLSRRHTAAAGHRGCRRRGYGRGGRTGRHHHHRPVSAFHGVNAGPGVEQHPPDNRGHSGRRPASARDSAPRTPESVALAAEDRCMAHGRSGQLGDLDGLRVAHDCPAGGAGVVPGDRRRVAGVSVARMVGPAVVLASRAFSRPRPESGRYRRGGQGSGGRWRRSSPGRRPAARA